MIADDRRTFCDPRSSAIISKPAFIGKIHEAPQQVFRLLFYSLSYFIGAAGLRLSKVLAARKKNLSNARARKNKYTARMLADARKDHSIPLLV